MGRGKGEGSAWNQKRIWNPVEWSFFFFLENGWLLFFNYFYKKAPSQMFEKILNTILESARLCKNS